MYFSVCERISMGFIYIYVYLLLATSLNGDMFIKI